MAKKSKKELKEAVKASAKKRAAAKKQAAAAALPDGRSKPKNPRLGGHVNMSIRDILDFVNGDKDVVIAVSRKSLVHTRLAQFTKEASDELDLLETL